VRIAIGDIVKLVCPERAIGFCFREAFGEPPRVMDIVIFIRVGDRVDFNQLGAKEAHGEFFLFTLRARHDDFH